VSMDITFITTGNWSAFYERDKLAETVDYLVVMAYDEHWATSRKAGSVASFPWVEQNLQKLLEVVPNRKLILGVPLYARLWEEKETGELSSKALSMAEVKEWLTAHHVTPKYDEISGQNYAEYYDAATKSTYRIWLEDELSLRKRADLALKYDLKGVASWSRYFADETAWLALLLENKQVAQNE
jgi:spore germination protein YaaH